MGKKKEGVWSKLDSGWKEELERSAQRWKEASAGDASRGRGRGRGGLRTGGWIVGVNGSEREVGREGGRMTRGSGGRGQPRPQKRPLRLAAADLGDDGFSPEASNEG